MKAVLSGDENAVYDSVAAAIRNFDDQAVFTVRSETAVSMERVIEIARIAQETPEFFWVESITWCTWTNNPDGTRTYTLDITYWLTKEERNAYLPLLEAKLARLQDQFGASDIFEASKQVNKYLAYNTSYVQNKAEQLEHPYDTILGPLIFAKLYVPGMPKHITISCQCSAMSLHTASAIPMTTYSTLGLLYAMMGTSIILTPHSILHRVSLKMAQPIAVQFCRSSGN